MENSLFIKASRLKLRISYKGLISVEDLWDLPIGVLDTLAINYNKLVKNANEETFISSGKVKSSEEIKNELAFEIIKYILNVKVDERDAKANDLKKKQEIAKLEAILSKKKDAELEGLSAEDIAKKIEELKK